LGEYSEIVADMGRAATALPYAQKAVTNLEAIIAAQTDTKLTPERKMWEGQLAQLYGILGHISESAGKKPEAKTAFQKALTIWERIVPASPNDESVVTALNWSKERLAKLK
jgi:tetratricopeptide (TPR) repeat protein